MAGEVPPTSHILSSCIWEKWVLRYSCHLKTVLPDIEYRALYRLPRKKYLCIATAFYIGCLHFGVNIWQSHSWGHDYEYRLHTSRCLSCTCHYCTTMSADTVPQNLMMNWSTSQTHSHTHEVHGSQIVVELHQPQNSTSNHFITVYQTHHLHCTL